MDKIYIILSELISPLVPLWLFWRRLKGKEDKTRFRERFGYASLPRPKGQLLWLHAASVGESTSILPLITKLRARFPALHILVTTGTKTSADLMAKRLPKEVLHQYVPVDTRDATWRFMRHWRPDMVFFVESEFWPNLVFAADSWQCFMGVINARMSEKSFRFWNNFPSLIRKMLGCFNIVFAQSEDDKKRLAALGAKKTAAVGNIKYDGEPLPSDDARLLSLTAAIGTRPVWLAASTHPGEEILIAATHKKLSARVPTLLTLIVPRHPARGGEIAGALQKQFRIALRSRGDLPKPSTEIYIGDTLGELGLFYRAADIVFMGGSLVPHGGQNPLEPARLSCAILTGPHTHNFSDIYGDLEKMRACSRVANAEALAEQVNLLFKNTSEIQSRQDIARQFVEKQSGATDRLLEKIAPIFNVGKL
jgi:3-deoxy-D-manno-octulosonic-acid transferase